MATYSSAGVYQRERDLSLVASPSATSYGGLAGWSPRGKVGITILTNPSDINLLGGLSTNWMASYTGWRFLQQSQRLYFNRVVSTTNPPSFGVLDIKKDTETDPKIPTKRTVVYVAKGTIIEPVKDYLFTIAMSWPGEDNNKFAIRIANVNDVEKTFTIAVYEKLTNGTEQLVVEPTTVSRNPDAKNGNNMSIYMDNIFHSKHAYITCYNNILEDLNLLPAEYGMTSTSSEKHYFDGATNGGEVTSGQIMTGYEEFANADEYSIQMLLGNGYTASMPGQLESEPVYVLLDEIARQRDDAIAILDVPIGMKFDEAVAWKKETGIVSSYSAFYKNYLKVYDQINDKEIWIPNSGMVGAIYAYTDYNYDVWSSPAGLNRGVLSVLDVEESLDQGKRDYLFENSVNPIYKHKDGAYVIWGDKTAQMQESLFGFVNVRRYINMLKVNAARAMDYTVFDINNEYTWTNQTEILRRMLKTYKGHNQDTAVIICDGTNNSDDNRNIGQNNIDIYIQPFNSVRYIQLTWNIMRYGMTVTEAIAAGG